MTGAAVQGSGGAGRSGQGGKPSAEQPPTGPDVDAFWTKMGGMLGGLESRMKSETDQMRGQLTVAVDAIGDLGVRVERTERRLQGLEEEVISIVDKKLASREALPGNTVVTSSPLDHPI